MDSSLKRGDSFPLGATCCSGGVNFSLFSKAAQGIDLLFFDTVDQESPSKIVHLSPRANKTYHYWHIFIPDVGAGQLYGYRAHGPFIPEAGLRFDSSKVLLDAYSKGVAVPGCYSRKAASCRGEDNCASAMKSVVVDPSDYDWEGDSPLRRSPVTTVIYELHIRGFTCHHTSGVPPEQRGTYAGVIEKIPYLVDLGISAVELLPVFQFDPQDAPPGKINYWGYAPLSFFSPHSGYSSRTDPLGPIREFKDMVKALHRAGIEVILDVVFNHTAEGNHEGPALSFKGIDNPTYYILERDKASYANYCGTGNTLSANSPVLRRMILDSLRYWVREMHVDGFRFDLASILFRDDSGQILSNPPVVWDIESDPCLAGVKLIAEAWDAAGLYQVGRFVGDSWREWNGKFRDDVRSFFRGDDGAVGRFADRVIGSPEIYSHKQREAEQSVNFITCHDGFTLNDLVSYSSKNNFANGEQNKDGGDDNRSFNCGHEGPSSDPAVERLRRRQIKNFLTVTLLSLGVPMITMGDEMRRTQLGNNNAYCQDNELSWLDWSLLEKHADIHRFAKLLIHRRIDPSFEEDLRNLNLSQFIRHAALAWSGVRLNDPDWGFFSHSLALNVEVKPLDLVAHFIFNAHREPLDFQLPVVSRGVHLKWQRWIDTAFESPNDIVDGSGAPVVEGFYYRMEAHSVAVLVSGRGARGDC